MKCQRCGKPVKRQAALNYRGQELLRIPACASCILEVEGKLKEGRDRFRTLLASGVGEREANIQMMMLHGSTRDEAENFSDSLREHGE